jgi:alkaline phosphatase D
VTPAPISRRAFLAGSAVVLLAACSGSGGSSSEATDAPSTTVGGTEPPATTAAASTTAPTTTAPAPPAPLYEGASDPFTLGVASGEPLPDSVLLWTRLLPEGQAIAGDLAVEVEVATDADFTDVVLREYAVAPAAHGSAVHHVAAGLEPATAYAYRFRAGAHASAVGRTTTAPAAGDAPARLRLAAASCQHYEDGFYAAHADIAAAAPDLVAWLGDYIYEGAAGLVGQGGAVRTHGSPEPMDLRGYRARYALYKRDANLQAAHAVCPWIVIWDDHEVENNYAGDHSEDDVPVDQFRARRAAAYQAWWEHTPTRLDPPTGPDYKVYRAQEWGSLAHFVLLDTRQYRTDQACGDVTLQLAPPCPEVTAPGRTLTGSEQEAWLGDQLRGSKATWNVITQQVVMADATINGAVLNYDQWDGYPASRQRVLDLLRDSQATNPVVITGDIHLAAVAHLYAGARGTSTPTAVEFISTSISSSGNVPAGFQALISALPGFVDGELAHRGWTLHTITPRDWTAELRIVADATKPQSDSSTYGRYRVVAGTPGVKKLSA